jgi:hypothetical protein
MRRIENLTTKKPILSESSFDDDIQKDLDWIENNKRKIFKSED